MPIAKEVEAYFGDEVGAGDANGVVENVLIFSRIGAVFDNSFAGVGIGEPAHATATVPMVVNGDGLGADQVQGYDFGVGGVDTFQIALIV